MDHFSTGLDSPRQDRIGRRPEPMRRQTQSSSSAPSSSSTASAHAFIVARAVASPRRRMREREGRLQPWRPAQRSGDLAGDEAPTARRSIPVATTGGSISAVCWPNSAGTKQRPRRPTALFAGSATAREPRTPSRWPRQPIQALRQAPDASRIPSPAERLLLRTLRRKVSGSTGVRMATGAPADGAGCAS